jgi:hypothetical protein
MKKLGVVIVSAAFLVLLLSPKAEAGSFTFGDTSLKWTGSAWSSVAGTPDTFGTPDILGGSGTYSASGYLSSISFNYIQNFTNDHVAPGDLFIDANADGFWDFVVNGYNNINAGSYGLYSIHLAENVNSGYIHSQDAWTWAGGIRTDHPVAVDVTGMTPIEQVTRNAWTNVTGGPYTLTYTIPDLKVLLGSSFTVSFMPNCANDVLYETVNTVPEPSTLLLLGGGMLVAAGFVRRKK